MDLTVTSLFFSATAQVRPLPKYRGKNQYSAERTALQVPVFQCSRVHGPLVWRCWGIVGGGVGVGVGDGDGGPLARAQAM
jgi:hypothetical protein